GVEVLDPELAARPVRAVTHRAEDLGPEVIGVGVHEWYADLHPAMLAATTPAAALLVDRPGRSASGSPVLQVANANVALSTLAAELEGRPAQRIPIVGVTGTDGKTTTTTLVASALTRLGWRVARTGTLGAQLAGAPHPLSRTVPEPPELHALFSAMLREGCEVAVMEIGSFGLRFHRADAVPFHIGVFTNL
ncbi:hypothetical protein KDM41_18705, partial [bacterium]|nr:hypothetical protein [bacterium]